MQSSDNYFFFGASSVLAQSLIKKIIINEPNSSFYLFSKHVDKISISANKNIEIFSYKSTQNVIKIIDGIDLRNTKFFFLQSLPEEFVHKYDLYEYFNVNTFSQIELMDYIKSKDSLSKIFYISSILSGYWYSKKYFYSTSKNIVEEYIKTNKYHNCYILKLPPFKSNLFSKSSNRIFTFKATTIAEFIFKIIKSSSHSRDSKTYYIPSLFRLVVYFLNLFFAIIKF